MEEVKKELQILSDYVKISESLDKSTVDAMVRNIEEAINELDVA